MTSLLQNFAITAQNVAAFGSQVETTDFLDFGNPASPYPSLERRRVDNNIAAINYVPNRSPCNVSGNINPVPTNLGEL